MMTTQAELKQELHYNEETGQFMQITPTSCHVGGVVGYFNRKNGYIRIMINKHLYQAHRLAWLYVYGHISDDINIDHINGVRCDNRISNLRLATGAENQANREKISNNTSGYKGVFEVRCQTKHGITIKWKAQCQIDNKSHYLGLSTTKEEASAAYQTFAKLHHGEFYRVPTVLEN